METFLIKTAQLLLSLSILVIVHEFGHFKLAPAYSKYKVYIIDEVHMLSTSAFNALLLTLEEPPKHVVFILATTNIEAVPITILSRCQILSLVDSTEVSTVDNSIIRFIHYLISSTSIIFITLILRMFIKSDVICLIFVVVCSVFCYFGILYLKNDDLFKELISPFMRKINK